MAPNLPYVPYSLGIGLVLTVTIRYANYQAYTSPTPFHTREAWDRQYYGGYHTL